MTLSLFSSSAYALRCGSSIVSKGDSSFKIKKLCGEPLYIDQWEVIYSETNSNSNVKSKLEKTEIHENWTYNFGSSKLVRYLRFVDKELVDIETGSYGFDGKKQRDYSKCGFHASLSDSKIDIFKKCGIPNEKIKRSKLFQKNIIGNKKTKNSTETIETLETWIYENTKSKNIYHINFTNGKVSNIKRE